MNFSETVRSARLRAGLTQQQLADSAGLSLRTITNYECARSLPRSKHYYRKLAKALSLDPDYLESLPAVSLPPDTANSSRIRQIQELCLQFYHMMADPALSEWEKDLLLFRLGQAYWQARGIPHPFS